MRRSWIQLAVAVAFVSSVHATAAPADKKHAKKPAPKAPAPPAPPSDPRAKFPKASKNEPHSRVITLKPGQTSIDQKTLHSAPTANDWGTRQRGKRPMAKAPHTRLPPATVVHSLPPGVHRAGNRPKPKPVAPVVKKKKPAKRHPKKRR